MNSCLLMFPLVLHFSLQTYLIKVCRLKPHKSLFIEDSGQYLSTVSASAALLLSCRNTEHLFPSIVFPSFSLHFHLQCLSLHIKTKYVCEVCDMNPTSVSLQILFDVSN